MATLSLEAENRFDEIDRVNQAFEAFSAEHGVPLRVRRTLKAVLDDVLSNVISYGWDDGGRHVIAVGLELTRDRLTARVSDDGSPFNPLEHAAPDPGLEVEERELGGLGIYLMENLVDEVTYAREGGYNVVVLVKYLPRTDWGEGGHR